MFRYYRFKYHNTSRQGWREEEVEKEEEGEPKQTAHVHTHTQATYNCAPLGHPLLRDMFHSNLK